MYVASKEVRAKYSYMEIIIFYQLHNNAVYAGVTEHQSLD